MRRFRISALFALVAGLLSMVPPPALAITQLLDLLLLPTTDTVNRLNIDLQVDYAGNNLEDSALTRLAGNVLSTIEYEVVGGVPVISGLSLTGGNVTLRGESSDDVTFDIGLPPFAGVEITGNNLGGTFATTDPPSSVTNNQFASADHEVFLNQGTFAAEGYGLLADIDEELNLGTSPLSLSQEAGIGTISLVQIGEQVGLEKTYEITISLPINDNHVIEIDNNGNPIPVMIDVSGAILARDTFTITVPLAGDYNSDGVVDAADYTVWRNSVGSVGANLPADGNGDAKVDADDYSIWKDNFGQPELGVALQAGVTAVPEPAFAGLTCMLAAAAVLGYRCRKG